MDLQSIKEQIAGLSLYDVKAAVRKAQNGNKWFCPVHPLGCVMANTVLCSVVMNYTEMEAKVSSRLQLFLSSSWARVPKHLASI